MTTSWSLRTGTAAALGAAIAVAMTTGCATVQMPPRDGEARPPSRSDPWEPINRKLFAFNEAVDDAVISPVATAWRDVVPQFVRTGVANFFGNFDDAWSSVNHVLQGKIHSGLEMGFRVVVNTTFGLGGVLDPASEMKLEKRAEDLGQTLGVWGVRPGPFLMLPLLGPSSLRDGIALPADRWLSPSLLTRSDGKRFLGTALNVVDTRARLLSTTSMIEDVALDRYSFVRDGYFARRRDLVWDGAPPLEDFVDEPPFPASKPAPAPPR